MPIEFQQMLLLPPATYGPDLNGSIKAVVTGSNDDALIAAECETQFPYSLTINNYGVPTLVFRQGITLTQQAEEAWHAVAKYKKEEPKNDDRKDASGSSSNLEQGRTQFDISFDIGARQTLIKHGIASNQYDKASPNYTATVWGDHRINSNTDGTEIVGANFDVPFLTFSETHYLRTSKITNFYLATMYKLVGSVNSTITRGFEVGELLLQRITGNKRDSEYWQLTYSWAFQENIANETVATVPNVTKKGWHYAWVEEQRDFNATTESAPPVVAGLHVVQVYPEKDHTQLEGVTA